MPRGGVWRGRVFGDTLRSNDVMIGLARKSGFNFIAIPTTGSWCASRNISTTRRGIFLARAGGLSGVALSGAAAN